MSLGLGFGLFGFRKFDQNTKTLKLAKVGLAKVGQAQNPILANPFMAIFFEWFGQLFFVLCQFEGPGASNTTKIPREDTQRGKKRTNFAAGEGKKKSQILGGPGEGRSREGRSWEGGLGKGGPGKG